jgi:hypothetical protein
LIICLPVIGQNGWNRCRANNSKRLRPEFPAPQGAVTPDLACNGKITRLHLTSFNFSGWFGFRQLVGQLLRQYLNT